MKGLYRSNHTTIIARKLCADCSYVMCQVDKRRRFCVRCLTVRRARGHFTTEHRALHRQRQEDRETAKLVQVLDELFAIRAYAEGA